MNRFFAFAVLTLFLSGCGETINGRALAIPQIQVFHDRLNEGNFEAIWDAAHKDFKESGDQEKIFALLEAIKRKLGSIESSSVVNWRVNTHNTVTNVVLVSDTQYTEGQATETFTFRIDRETASLIGYYINSMDMMIK